MLKELGHGVHDDFLHIDKETDKEYTKKKSGYVYKYIIEHIKKSDVFISEMSYRSAPVSYQLTYALENKMPSLYLSESNRGSQPHAVFKGNPSKYLTIVKYKREDLKQKLKKFFKRAEKLMKRRFNFILPAKMDDYLRVSAAVEGMSKGEYLRRIIEDKMDEDERFGRIKSSI